MRALVLLGLMAATASADPLDLRESTLRDPDVDIAAADVHFTWRADAIAATSGSGSRADRGAQQTASVGGELAVAGPDCDFVAAGGQADARTGAETPLALQQWASVCPLSGIFRIAIDHRLVWDVTPRLLAPPRLRPGGNRSETIGIAMRAFVEQPVSAAHPGPREYGELLAVREAVTFGWAAGEGHDVSATTDLDVIHYVRERRDASAPLHVHVIALAFDLVSPSALAMTTRATAATIAVDAARVDGMQVGGGVRLGASFGFGQIILGDMTRVERGRGGWLAGRAGLSLERDAGPMIARVAAGRELWPTWDGRAVIDDRITGSVRGTIGPVRGSVEVSAARARLLSIATGLTATTVGGVAASAERDLGAHLTARGHLEVGRSVYAGGATFEQPRWAAEGLLSLQLHAGNR